MLFGEYVERVLSSSQKSLTSLPELLMTANETEETLET